MKLLLVSTEVNPKELGEHTQQSTFSRTFQIILIFGPTHPSLLNYFLDEDSFQSNSKVFLLSNLPTAPHYLTTYSLEKHPRHHKNQHNYMYGTLNNGHVF